MFGLGTPEIILLIGAILLLGLFVIPILIARKKKHFLAILLLDIFLGWTGIGWLAALIWAILSPPKANWYYTCDRCNAKVGSIDKLKVFVCPQCKHEEVFEK